MPDFIDADMHNHTTGSDGKQSPLLMLLRASNKGKSIVSISDHDSVKGYTQLKEQIRKFLDYYNSIESNPDLSIEEKAKAKSGGKNLLRLLSQIHILPAAELITSYNGSTVEILGYGIDPEILDHEIKRIHEGLPSGAELLVNGVNRIIDENGLSVDKYIIDNRSNFKRLFFHELTRHKENRYIYETIPGETEDEKAEIFAEKYLQDPSSPFYVNLEVAGERTVRDVRKDFLEMIEANKNSFLFDPNVIANSHQVSGEFFNELLKDPKAVSLLLDPSVDTLKKFLYGELYNKKSPFFIDMSPAKPSIPQTIEAIHNSGGKAFLAHPGRYSKLFDVVEEIEHGTLLDGVDGVEVFYPTHSLELQNYLLQKARERGLLVSGGSDDHKAPVDGPEYKIGSVNIPNIPETEWIRDQIREGKDYLASEQWLKPLIDELQDYQNR